MYHLICAILLVLLFFLSGIQKINNFSNIVVGFKNKYLPKLFLNLLPSLFFDIVIVIVILLEIFAPIIITYSFIDFKYKLLGQISTYLLILFTILATIIYHFPPINQEYYKFLQNLSLVGGLMLLAEKF